LKASFNQDGETALIEAAFAGHASVASLLLAAKADVNHADNVRLCNASMYESAFDAFIAIYDNSASGIAFMLFATSL
jgi:ankyrin repeat protein